MSTYTSNWYFQKHITLQWRHNEHDGVWNHQPHDCFAQLFIQAQINKNINALCDRWIPPTKGQQRRKCILGSMMSHQRVIVGLSQSAPAVGWGSPLHAWLASVNWIGGARCLNRRYRYGARGMHYHILLWQYSQNCYTYNSVVKNTCSPCHKDACIKISIGNTEWLLCYKGVS